MAPKSKEQKIVELSDKIATLKGIGETDRAAELEAELAQLTGKSATPPAELPPAEDASSAASNEFVVGSEEDWNNAGSKFAKEGKHLSEAGMPYWKTPGVSIAFPFTIIEDGADNGKANELFAGVQPKSMWKTIEILEAMGVPHYTKNVNGRKSVVFDANEVPGKQFLSIWTPGKFTRPDGSISEYTKPTAAVAVGASEGSVL
jgi:hypothetical protein